MFVRDWYRPSFWRWWWLNRAPLEARLALVLVLVGAVAGAGYVFEGLLTPASGASVYTVITTVRALERVEETVTGAGRLRVVRVRTREVVTLRGSQRVVRDLVPVSVERTTTVVDRVTVARAGESPPHAGRTLTVTTPSVTLVRTRLVARPRAPVRTRVVTVRDPAGPRVLPHTVTELRTLTAASTRTVTSALTGTAGEPPIESVRTLTGPAVTTTVTSTRTATLPATTVTSPVTSTATDTVTTTRTATLPVTTTVATTVTVTSTRTETQPLTVIVSVPLTPPPTSGPAGGPPAGRTST